MDILPTYIPVSDKWADQFKDVYREPPSWYNDPSNPSMSGFNAVIFTNAISSFGNSFTAAATSTPGGSGSGAGGFSGGGFGGGGGGSW